MRIKEYATEEILKKSKNQYVFIFGAGNNTKKFFEEFKSFKFENRIEAILDNKVKKDGTYEVNGKKIKLLNPDAILKYKNKKKLIIITPNDYKSILAQLQNYKDVNMTCCLFPKYFYKYERKLFVFFCKMPLSKTVLMMGGTDTCGNTIAFSEYLDKKKIKVVWLDKKPGNSRDGFSKSVITPSINYKGSNLNRIRYIYYRSCSKWLIFENSYIDKMREDQISVYLKHGEMSIKNVIGLIDLPKDLNYTFAASEFSKRYVSLYNGINNERVALSGMPRNDIFFNSKVDKKLAEKLNINKFDKTIIWMPTFRKTASGRNDSDNERYTGLPIIKTNDDIEMLNNALKNANVQLLIKPHKYSVDIDKTSISKSNYIRIIRDKDFDFNDLNVQKMLMLTDGMITDYSSVMFDYLLLNKPICFTVDDMDSYKLGFVDNYEELLAGDKIMDINQLIQFILNVSEGVDPFNYKRNELNKKLNKYGMDGKNSERICKYLGIE